MDYGHVLPSLAQAELRGETLNNLWVFALLGELGGLTRRAACAVF